MALTLTPTLTLTIALTPGSLTTAHHDAIACIRSVRCHATEKVNIYTEMGTIYIEYANIYI